MMCYGSLAHMSHFFTSDDICIGLKILASGKASDLQYIKAKNAQMEGKGSTCMDAI